MTRTFWIALAVLGLGLAGFLIGTGLERGVVFAYTPSEIAVLSTPPDTALRVGGRMAPGSLVVGTDGIRFIIDDGTAQIMVETNAPLPDMAAEGRGVVAEGRLDGRMRLRATRILARHDETYAPPAPNGGHDRDAFDSLVAP
ncbi:MAG: cytochrome c maturation protein CcmE [Pseudomonadota bacterium]|nr:cytochrome c maturation protein CcmE [Pseudomonadota bacterium]